MLESIRPLRWGFLFSLLTLVFGFFLGAAFGAAEDPMKSYLKNKGEAALATAYKGDKAKLKATLSKSWTYFKRAHLHANGLGTSALALLFLLALLSVAPLWKVVTAWALGLGSFGYSAFWLLAGMAAPGLGSTGAAKESLAWLAIPSSAACILGLFSVLAALVFSLYLSPSKSAQAS